VIVNHIEFLVLNLQIIYTTIMSMIFMEQKTIKLNHKEINKILNNKIFYIEGIYNKYLNE
jgi:hypothetical protein